MLRFTAILFTCLVIDAVVCQIHLGPIGDSNEVNCYQCEEPHGHDPAHGPGHEHFYPACLSHVKKCHHDEVCKIVYGDKHTTTIRCQKSQDCAHETAHPMRNCTGGGVEARPNECQKCCTTSTCVDDLVNLMKLEAATSPDLMCPGDCFMNNLERCVTHAHRCHDGQFCEISREHDEVWGECKADHDYHHCSEELNKHSCGGAHHGPGRCFIDCCTTNACLQQTLFGAYLTTQAPATTMPPATTTMAPVMTSTGSPAASLWERLHGDCKDQLTGDTCKNLMATQDVCHDRLALSICPDSCGLCSAINSTACSDAVVNDGCKNLQQHEDVCNDKMAVFVCPDTCNLCDELINSLITSLVEGNSSATDVPATLLPPSADPSAYPTFDCNDLDGVDCGLLDGLCGSSFVGVVCPQNCEACANAIKTQTVGMVVDLASTTPATAAPTAAPTTMMPDPATTAAPATTTMMTNGTDNTIKTQTVGMVVDLGSTTPATASPTTMMQDNTTAAAATTMMMQDNTTAAATTSMMQGNTTAAAAPTTMMMQNNTTTSAATTMMQDNTTAAATTMMQDNTTAAATTSMMMQDNTTAAATTSMMIHDNTTTSATTSMMMHDNTTTSATTSMMQGNTTTAASITTTTMHNTTPVCADHLNGLNCADLKDVCTSIMALSVCPKFCGLC